MLVAGGARWIMKRLKQLRIEKGWSQTELAKKLNIAQNTLSSYERGTRDPDTNMLNLICTIFGVSSDYMLGRDEMPQLDNILSINKKRYPLIGDIACGVPVLANQDFESYVVSGSDIDADLCLRAKGDSMIGARILDGDIVFIRRQSAVENGEIAAVIIGEEATLKRVYYYPSRNKIVLAAENPKYAPIVYTDEELSEVHIIGKAIAFQSDVR